MSSAVLFVLCALAGVGLGLLVARAAAAFAERRAAVVSARRWAQFNAALDRETR